MTFVYRTFSQDQKGGSLEQKRKILKIKKPLVIEHKQNVEAEKVINTLNIKSTAMQTETMSSNRPNFNYNTPQIKSSDQQT